MVKINKDCIEKLEVESERTRLTTGEKYKHIANIRCYKCYKCKKLSTTIDGWFCSVGGRLYCSKECSIITR